jgi:hypothetical protein
MRVVDPGQPGGRDRHIPVVASCGGCAQRWSDPQLAHCRACHSSWPDVTGFDAHLADCLRGRPEL